MKIIFNSLYEASKFIHYEIQPKGFFGEYLRIGKIAEMLKNGEYKCFNTERIIFQFPEKYSNPKDYHGEAIINI